MIITSESLSFYPIDDLSPDQIDRFGKMFDKFTEDDLKDFVINGDIKEVNCYRKYISEMISRFGQWIDTVHKCKLAMTILEIEYNSEDAENAVSELESFSRKYKSHLSEIDKLISERRPNAITTG